MRKQKIFQKVLSLALAAVMMMGMGTNAFAASSNNTDESQFIREIDGTLVDIRKSAAPNSYKSSRGTNSSETVTTDSVSETKEGIGTRASMVTGGGEYPYNATYWNDADNIYRANCYGYMLNRISNDTGNLNAGYVFQPGFITGNYYQSLTGSDIIKAVESDMSEWGRTIRKSSYSEKPSSNEYKVALVIASKANDYHWYRQDKDGGWSHKPGLTEVTYKDASGKSILDPQTCDRNYSYANYSTWCGYYIVTK